MLQQSFDPLTDGIAFLLQLGKVAFEALDVFEMLGEVGISLIKLKSFFFELNFEFQRMFFCRLDALLSSGTQFPLLAQKIDGPQNTLFQCLERRCLKVVRVGCILLDL
jgi:hypothetical protein